MRAAASSFEHVGNFTVLNGAQGVTGALAEVIQQAGVLSGMARQALSPDAAEAATGNGHRNPPPTATTARPMATPPMGVVPAAPVPAGGNASSGQGTAS